MKDNFHWGCRNNVITFDIIDSYKELFNEFNIWHNEPTVKSGFILLYDNSTAKLYDNSTAKLYGNSYINTYSFRECKLNDKSIMRVISTNSIYFSDESINFIKI